MKARRHNRFTYRMEFAVIRIRDWISPPTKALADVGLRAGMTVLDFGCGPGGFSLAAAQLVGPEGRVYALDIQPLALKSVRRAAARRGLGNILALDGSRLTEVPEGGVDMVLLFDVLHIGPQPGSARAMLDAAHHVLKPDGVLCVRDHHLHDEALANAVTGGGLFAAAGREGATFLFAPKKTGKAAT